MPDVITDTTAYVYLLQDPTEERHYKIGFAKSVKRRLTHLNGARAVPLRVVDMIAVSNSRAAYDLEQCIHVLLYHFRIRGEWFELPSVRCWTDAILIARELGCDKERCIGSIRIQRPVASASIPDQRKDSKKNLGEILASIEAYSSTSIPVQPIAPMGNLEARFLQEMCQAINDYQATSRGDSPRPVFAH